MKSHTLLFLAATLGLYSACNHDLSGPRDHAGGAGGAGSGSTGTGTGTGTGGSGGSLIGPSTPSVSDVKTRCAQSKLAPPMLRRLTRTEIENSILDVFPQIAATYGGVKLGPDPLSSLKFTNDASVLVVGGETAKEILKTAKDVAELVTASATLSTLLPCATGAADQTCATTFINTFAPRIYRRAITDEERSELVAYHGSVSGRSNFTMGIKWTLISMLQSPQFLYRSEIGDASGQLSPDEIASEVSYTFGGTPPSADLLSKAQSGALSSPDALVQAAIALQQTTTGREVMEQFFREWTGYEKVVGTTKDAVSNFDVIQNSMTQETRQFIDDVVFTAGGNVKDLLTAKYTFVDSNLATFYGLPQVTAFTKVDRPANWGIGLLAQGSILAGTSHPTMTSPVFRGLLVFTNMLCNARPKPPPVVPTIESADAGTSVTTRQRFESVHAQPGCSTCHQAFEPFGYAFEHFDETGRYRAKENGFDINAAATAQLPDQTMMSFNGLDDLATKLAAMPGVTDCVSGLMATYAFSGGGGTLCLAEEARAGLANGTYGLRDFYTQIAKSPSVTRRAR
jgi:Protein of unknown function (DUF1588)/Protein of unknown function (DUF1592)/Protein of unknown function (DUF1595)/Protein of unknown function (DUF1587)